jgi:hypothetical protein
MTEQFRPPYQVDDDRLLRLLALVHDQYQMLYLVSVEADRIDETILGL